MGRTGPSAARLLLRQTVGLDSRIPLNCDPKILVVPSALETGAEQNLVAVIYPSDVTDANAFTNRLTLIPEARLDATSTAQWHLFSDPARFPVLELAHLAGAPGPQIEQRPGWESLGQEYRCYFDVGVGAIGWRGAVRSEGS